MAAQGVGLELQNEIEQFYYREAQLLDHRAYEAWFALLEKTSITSCRCAPTA